MNPHEQFAAMQTLDTVASIIEASPRTSLTPAEAAHLIRAFKAELFDPLVHAAYEIAIATDIDLPVSANPS